jgi:ABC-type uncharacterized transport system permease subunit
MTTTDTAPATMPKAPGAKKRGLSTPVVLIAVAALFLLLAAVRAATGANDLTSSGQIAGALAFSVPIGMAGLGGLWSERAGVVNIGLEGMMILGTFAGAYVSWRADSPWLGVLAGIAAGALGGALHALATVTFGVDHVVSGVAITILAGGVTGYLAKILFTSPAAEAAGGGPKQSPPVKPLPTITVPGLSHWLSTVEAHHWFLVSDLAGVIGGVVTQLSVLTVLAALLVVATYYILWKTPFGLRLRSCGESPTAAESLGVNVYRYKYAAVTVSGGLAGLGGVFLSMVSSSIYQNGQTGGRGYIGLAAMIFGNWRPGGLVSGALLFGYTDSLQLRGGGTSVHALLLVLTVLVGLIALYNLYRRRLTQGISGLVVAAAVGVWYAATDTVPGEFVTAAPYITTLLVLALASQRLRMPKADGLVYRRGEAT